MKHWIAKMITVLIMLLPAAVFAVDCQDPAGKAYTYDGITVNFVQGYQQDTIAQITADGYAPVFYNYVWDASICRATLLSEPPIYLDFDESWFDVSENPFRFSVVTSVD